MSSMGETSLSFLSSILPNNTANTIIGASFLAIAAALIIHHISPTRLTHLLVALMHETDATYISAVEAGVIPCDVDTEALSKLQIKVSELRKESLRNSLSTRKMLAEFLRGRSLSLHRCIRDVQDLKTQIEVHISTFSRELSGIILTIQKDLEGRAATHPQPYGCRDGSMDHVCSTAPHSPSRLPVPLRMQLVVCPVTILVSSSYFVFVLLSSTLYQLDLHSRFLHIEYFLHDVLIAVFAVQIIVEITVFSLANN
ncbi:hypothetical protein C8J57DRAFT_1219180 [Mycena rebaudengoi]|nr:hypothetical protein C8J57DRAFT_1219180 [Mycena rebaudengoi]